MKKSSIVLIVIIAIIAIVVIMGISSYNGIVSKKETVNTKLSDIDVNLQRRADLIPNLVNTVKGAAQNEAEIIESVSNARTKLVNSNTVEEKSEANAELTNSLSTLLFAISENYPEITATQAFISLQDDLAGTENRLAIARRDYNEAVKKYNSSIQKFPANIFAGMFGFEKASYFEASEASTEVPSVDFN